MKKIAEFMNCPEHFKMSHYCLEYRLCGVPGCESCAGIERKVRTPEIYFSKYNLSNEVIRWDDCPIVDSSDSDHYLSPESTSDYIKHNNMTIQQIKKGIPNPNKGDKEKNCITEARDRQIFQF